MVEVVVGVGMAWDVGLEMGRLSTVSLVRAIVD